MTILVKFSVLTSCTGSQEPIQKTQQCSTAKQRFVKKGVQWLFPLCTGTPGHNQIFSPLPGFNKVSEFDLFNYLCPFHPLKLSISAMFTTRTSSSCRTFLPTKTTSCLSSSVRRSLPTCSTIMDDRDSLIRRRRTSGF